MRPFCWPLLLILPLCCVVRASPSSRIFPRIPSCQCGVVDTTDGKPVIPSLTNPVGFITLIEPGECRNETGIEWTISFDCNTILDCKTNKELLKSVIAGGMTTKATTQLRDYFESVGLGQNSGKGDYLLKCKYHYSDTSNRERYSIPIPEEEVERGDFCYGCEATPCFKKTSATDAIRKFLFNAGNQQVIPIEKDDKCGPINDTGVNFSGSFFSIRASTSRCDAFHYCPTMENVATTKLCIKCAPAAKFPMLAVVFGIGGGGLLVLCGLIYCWTLTQYKPKPKLIFPHDGDARAFVEEMRAENRDAVRTARDANRRVQDFI